MRLLIVISDGQPASRTLVRGTGEYITRDTVLGVRADGVKVFGVGVDGTTEEMLTSIYGKDHLIGTTAQLTRNLGKALTKTARRSF
jgi:nitric oxide reductase activation protein